MGRVVVMRPGLARTGQAWVFYYFCVRHAVSINLSVDIFGDAARKERGLLDPAKRDPNERYCSLGDKLYEVGRYGQKTGTKKARQQFFFLRNKK